MSKKARREAAFTLIEIMVVVVIIGILAAVMISQFAGRTDEAAVRATRAMLSQVSTQVDLFKLDHGRYPDTLGDLMYPPAWVDQAKWKTAYFKQHPKDGWQRDFHYRQPGTNAPYDVVSFGANGVEGGTGYDEDLWSHDLYKRQ